MRKTSMLVVMAALAVIWTACGGGSSSSSDDGDTTSDTINLTGTVQTASVASASISGASIKSLFKATVEDSAAACDSCTVYSLGGTEEATGTCNSDGSFTLTPPKEDGEVHYFVKAEVGDEELWGYVSGTVTADTTSLDAEYINTDSLLVVTDMLEKLGVTDFSDLLAALGLVTAIPDTFDPFCFYKMQKEIISGADPEGSGLNDETAKMRDACKVYIAQESLPEGYGNMGQFMKDCVHGELEADVLAAVETAVESSGVDYLTDWGENYSTFAETINTFGSFVGDYMASTAGMTTATMSLSKSLGKAEGDSTVSSPCGDDGLAKSDDDYLDKWKEMMLDAEDLDQFKTVFGMKEGADPEEAFKTMMGQFDQFNDGGDWSTFDGEAMYSMFETYNGDYDSFFNDDGSFATEAFGTTYSYYMGTDFDSFGGDEDAMKEYFSGVGTQFASGEWEDFYGKEDIYAQQWQSEFEDGGEIVTQPNDEDATCMTDCFTDGGTFDTCQAECFGDQQASIITNCPLLCEGQQASCTNDCSIGQSCDLFCSTHIISAEWNDMCDVTCDDGT